MSLLISVQNSVWICALCRSNRVVAMRWNFKMAVAAMLHFVRSETWKCNCFRNAVFSVLAKLCANIWSSDLRYSCWTKFNMAAAAILNLLPALFIPLPQLCVAWYVNVSALFLHPCVSVCLYDKICHIEFTSCVNFNHMTVRFLLFVGCILVKFHECILFATCVIKLVKNSKWRLSAVLLLFGNDRPPAKSACWYSSFVLIELVVLKILWFEYLADLV